MKGASGPAPMPHPAPPTVVNPATAPQMSEAERIAAANTEALNAMALEGKKLFALFQLRNMPDVLAAAMAGAIVAQSVRRG